MPLKMSDTGDLVDKLAAQMVAAGLRHVFGVTGSGLSLRLISELEQAGARYFPVAHEAAGALMAGAVARMSDHSAASISIRGPGLANMVSGIVANRFEGNPAVSVSEAYGVTDSSHRAHKRLDHYTLLTGLVKAHIDLGSLDQVPEVLAHTRAEIPGPVHIDLSIGNPPRRTEAATRETPAPIAERRAPLEAFVQSAEHPVLIVGSLSSRRPWGERLSSLSIPVFTTAAGKGVVDERLPHSAGVYTGDGKDLAPEASLIDRADLVIGVGLRHTEVITPRQFPCPLILVDEVGDGLHEGFAASVHVVTPDPSAIIDDVLNALERNEWVDDVAMAMQRLRDGILSAGWSPATCFHVLDGLKHPHALVLDTGSFCTIGEHCWLAGPSRPFLGSSNARFMGTSIPSAIGLALARPGLPVICVTGDGGISPHFAELVLAVAERLSLCIVLMTDGLYNSVASVPQSKVLSRRAVTVIQASWHRAVETLGCEAHRVDTQEAFQHVVGQWSRKSPLFVEAVFDPEPYRRAAARLR